MIIRVSSLRLRTAVLLFLVALSAKAVAAHQETPEKFATVTGVVIDSRTDRPIANAQVYLELGRLAEVPSNYKRVTATGVTDLEGHFQFVSVMPRVYTLIVKKGGYLVSPLHVVEVDREVVLLKDHIRLDAAARVFALVVNDTGRAVPNARVVAVLPPVLQSSSLVRLLNEGGVTALTRTCNGQGRFDIVLPVDQPGMSLFAEARGYAPGIVSLGREGVLADRKEVVIRLPAGFTAHGRIIGEDGVSISGATIKAERLEPDSNGLGVQRITPETTSGDNGFFTLRGLEKSAYTLTISHANRATVRLPRIEIATSTIEIPEILLPSQAEISGVVKDPNGRTIVGARVLGRNMQENIIEETVSNGDGRFALTQFPRGANVLLWAEATGHVATNQRVEAPHNDVVLVLQRLGVLSGHVEDSDTGSAITDFRLLMAGGSEMGRFHSADGHFRWEDLPPGRWTLTAQAPGYQSANISDVEIHAGEVKEGIVFSLLKGVEVSGRVVDDATGEPLPGVRVSYRGSDDATSPTFFRSKTVSQDTDADGAFRLDGLPPTGVTLVVRSPLYAERQVTPSAEVGTAIEIRLSSGSEISGRVLGTDSLTPVVGARVSLFSENNGTGTTIASDSNGFFGFNHLQAGLYRVTAEATFGQASRQDIIVQENQRTDGILLNIKPGATLHGRITGTLPNEQPNINLIVRGPGGFSVFGSTDLEGSYRIEGVPAGSLELVASTSLFRSISTSIQVPEGIQDTVFNFEFPWAGRLRGTITQGGKPASFTNVALIPVDDQMVRGSTTTDSEGAYDVSGVSDGDYIIRVQKQRTVEESVRITGDTILDIEVPPME